MGIKRTTLAVGLFVTVASFCGAYLLHSSGPAKAAGKQRRPLYYHDPMHPAYKSDKPGTAPDCGMDLEPVYAEAESAGKTSADPIPGTVQLSDARQRMIGLATERVASGPGQHSIRLTGRVTPDETRVFRVTSLAEGVVRMVAPLGPGNFVKKDEVLASYFVAQRDLFNAFQNFFSANNNLDRALSSMDNSIMDQRNAQIRLTEELLATYGVTETQMRQMATSRQVTRDVEFRAPGDGIILTRAISPGQKLDRGNEIFKLADLSKVWVLADVFERDAALVHAGQMVRVMYQGKMYHGHTTEARDFDPKSRTLKVRVDLDNPDFTLRPDMFVDVELDVTQGAGLDVPSDAVLNTGRRAVVFVAMDDNRFEPREVVVGKVTGNRVRITAGLSAGESIVVSGLFLLDSESRLQLEAHQPMAPAQASSAMQPAKAEAGATPNDPVCGMPLSGEVAKQPHSDYHGKTIHFCSDACKSKFDAHAERYAGKAMSAMAEQE